MLLREHDLEILRQALAKDSGGAIVLVGEARTGKSRLLRELRRHAESEYYQVLPLASHGEHAAFEIDRSMTPEGFREVISGPQSAIDEEFRPILLLIDGYRPQPAFEDWFVGDFLPSTKTTKPPRVVVVAAYASDVERLRSEAQVVVNLTPISITTVETYLRILNQDMPEPMTDDEISAYARVLKDDLGLVDSLERLLKLES